MSDEWKISQGLKKKNQNLSFKNPDGALSASYDYMEKTAKKRKFETIVAYWSKGDDIFFKPKKKEDLMKSLKIYLEYCEENNIPKKGIYNNQEFAITEENPLNISFFENPNTSWGNFTRPPKEIVSISDTNTQYNIEISIDRGIFTTIRDQKRRIIKDFTFDRSAEISDDGNIIEYYTMKSTGDEKLDRQIIEYLVSKNPGFVALKKDEKGTYSKIQRQNVSKNETINPGIVIDGELSEDLQICVDKKQDKSSSELTYNSVIEAAQKIVDDCQQIYSMISELYKGKEQPNDAEPEEKADLIEVEEQQPKITQETDITSKVNENVDELSDTELDEFIERMDAKQKENQQKIERLKKIKRAKELILLSKQQDKEISELESQIHMKGKDIDE